MNKKIAFVSALSALFIAFWLFWIAISSQELVFLTINQNLSPVFGWLARIFSQFGEAWGMLVLLLICFFNDWKKSFLIGLGWLLGACYSWMFKLWLMKGAERPLPYFEKKNIPLQFVEGVDVHRFNTFPSGHTLTAFSIVFLAVLAFPQVKKSGQFALFLAAALCGLSRIILVQHWPLDVAGGAFLGGLAAVSAYGIWKKVNILIQTEKS